MGKVVQLFSIGTFRALFLIEEWERLKKAFNGDVAIASRAHKALCLEWGRIWGEDSDPIAAEEVRLVTLTDAELVEEWRRADVERRPTDLIAGEMERRNLKAADDPAQPEAQPRGRLCLGH